jgi:hypothetical protein
MIKMSNARDPTDPTDPALGHAAKRHKQGAESTTVMPSPENHLPLLRTARETPSFHSLVNGRFCYDSVPSLPATMTTDLLRFLSSIPVNTEHGDRTRERFRHYQGPGPRPETLTLARRAFLSYNRICLRGGFVGDLGPGGQAYVYNNVAGHCWPQEEYKKTYPVLERLCEFAKEWCTKHDLPFPAEDAFNQILVNYMPGRIQCKARELGVGADVLGAHRDTERGIHGTIIGFNFFPMHSDDPARKLRLTWHPLGQKRGAKSEFPGQTATIDIPMLHRGVYAMTADFQRMAKHAVLPGEHPRFSITLRSMRV